MVKLYAHLYFAGIRPNELRRMAGREKELLNLKTLTITIPANISKTRHERQIFISYHVALHRSIGDAALQAGNSEAIVKRHYLNTHTQDEGRDFFRIIPDLQKRKATLARSGKPSHSAPQSRMTHQCSAGR